MGAGMRYYPDLPCRIVLIPRSGEGDVLQFDTEPCHIFHFGNVHDNGDKVHSHAVERALAVGCGPDSLPAIAPGCQLDFSAVCIGKDFNMQFSHRVWLSNADVAPGHLYVTSGRRTVPRAARNLVAQPRIAEPCAGSASTLI